jgi:hypothetical protein
MACNVAVCIGNACHSDHLAKHPPRELPIRHKRNAPAGVRRAALFIPTHRLSFPLIVSLLLGSTVQLGHHKGQEVAASCLGHFGLAQIFSLSLPQTFFSQATGSKRIVVKVCSGRRDVLANPISSGNRKHRT